MSKGKEIIGDFNPAGDSRKLLIKLKSSELIDLIEEYGKCDRRKELAINQIEAGTMFGVKSLFH